MSSPSELRQLVAAIDDVVTVDPSDLAAGDTVAELYRQFHRLHAVVAGAAAAFDRSGAWAIDGARTSTAWLSATCRLPKPVVRRDVRLGRTVAERLPACRTAWTAGDIGEPHVSAVVALDGPRTEAVLDRDEAVLVEQAATLPYGVFRQALAYWQQMADPDGCELADEERRARRGVRLAATFQGMWVGDITLDSIGGAIVADELRRLEQSMFASDCAEARERASGPTPAPLRRTPTQRRADALVEMATRSRTAPPDGRRPAPLFSVLVGYETLRGRICELANGQVVTPGSLVPWLTEVDIERAVFGPADRVDVGPASRFFVGATRRAIELRDRTCVHPMCDVPADRCEADHIVPWRRHGPTTQENGRLLCGFHNRLRNTQPDWDAPAGTADAADTSRSSAPAERGRAQDDGIITGRDDMAGGTPPDDDPWPEGDEPSDSG